MGIAYILIDTDTAYRYRYLSIRLSIWVVTVMKFSHRLIDMWQHW